MGSWNGTCMISNLHITAGTDVAVFMLLENVEKKSFCYSNAMYDVCPIPFYGKYDDYGGVEDCTGIGVDIVVNEIKSKLYEFGTGSNESHDIAVNKNNFDISMLFEADQEDRLAIQFTNYLNGDQYDHRALTRKRENDGLTPSQEFELDRLANKLKGTDNHRQVTHVTIHGDIFKDIMEKFYIEEYVGDGKGTYDYRGGPGDSYIHIYFRDLVDSIPEYIRRMKEAKGNPNNEDYFRHIGMYRLLRLFGWNDENLAGRWLNSFNDSSNTFGLININEYTMTYCQKEDWDGLATFVKEALTGLWINSFMSYTRKAWVQTTGKGSQNNEHIGYKVLANSMLDIMKAEQTQYDLDNGEDEDNV